MRDAEKKRARLLNSNRKVNVIKGESKESKKIRDANRTTHMLIVVITVTINFEPYSLLPKSQMPISPPLKDSLVHRKIKHF